MDGVPFDKCSPRYQRHLPPTYEVNDGDKEPIMSRFILFFGFKVRERDQYHDASGHQNCNTGNDKENDVVELSLIHI